MQAFARFRLPDGTTAALGAGELVGRMPTATLRLNDGRISEAHAMVSLRGGTLQLLALRGRFAVHGRTVRDVELQAGLAVELAPGLIVEVLEVQLPHRVPALQVGDAPLQALPSRASLYGAPHPRLSPRWDPDADAWLWRSGSAWTLQRVGEAPTDVAEGDAWTVAGSTFTLGALQLDRAGPAATEAGGARPPLVIEARFHSVLIHRDDTLVLKLGGIGARIVSELVAMDGPVRWDLVAGEIWDDPERILLRRRWDIALVRLRAKLRGAGLDPHLVSATRAGHVELVLDPGDTVIDHT